MKQITAIAVADPGTKSLITTGGSKSFADLVNESARTYFAECKKVVGDWLADIPKAQGKTAWKLETGNITYKFGTLNPFLFESWSDKGVHVPAGAKVVQGHQQ
jgi:hypothetical protein